MTSIQVESSITGSRLPIEVSVTGAGVLEAWIDFNADGDWDDPGEQIIPMSNDPLIQSDASELCPSNLTGIASNIFADTGERQHADVLHRGSVRPCRFLRRR